MINFDGSSPEEIIFFQVSDSLSFLSYKNSDI